MAINDESVKQQSLNAYNQWKDVWRDHSRQNYREHSKNLADFRNVGIGKAVLCVANGYSFEQNIETIKEYQGNVDIICCDKTLGHLIDHGIKPTYCLVADAVVDYEKYMEPWVDQLDETVLFSTVTANPKWNKNGNWKDVYFFVNHDCLRSEFEFMELSNCQNLIPAATNVSNAMVVFLTQSDNNGKQNFFGYDKILLIGYDYSWEYGGKYYAFDERGGGKANYMRHMYLLNNAGVNAYTSSNLLFSAQWLEKYISTFQLNVVQCSEHTILGTKYRGGLESQMQYTYRPEDKPKVLTLLEKRDKMLVEARLIENQIKQIGVEHQFNFLKTV